MIALSLIVFREMMEICLIVSLVIFSAKEMKNLSRLILTGVALGIIGSIAIAFSLDNISEFASGMGQEIFNAALLFVTAAFIFTMLLYTSGHAAQIKNKITKKQNSFYGLLFIVAFTIFREGAEIVLLTYSHMMINNSLLSTIAGVTTGILTGVIFGILFYYGMAKISVSKMFTIVNWILIFFIAGLISQGFNFLIAADIISSSVETIWDSSAIISNNSFTGTFLNSMFGYISNPSTIYVTIYLTSLIIIITAYKGNKYLYARIE